MTSKEALTKLSNMASPYYWGTKEQIELISTVEQDLERLEELVDEYNNLKQDYDIRDLECCDLQRENELLKRDNQELHNRIKLSVQEHYADFMKDYKILEEECEELNKALAVLISNTQITKWVHKCDDKEVIVDYELELKNPYNGAVVLTEKQYILLYQYYKAYSQIYG